MNVEKTPHVTSKALMPCNYMDAAGWPWIHCTETTVSQQQGQEKAVLSEPGRLAEGKTSEVSFREPKHACMLPTSFTVPTAPQESAVPTWAWNCTQRAVIRRVPRMLNTIPYGNLLVFSVPLAQLASDTFLYSHCLWGTEPELTAKLIILFFGGGLKFVRQMKQVFIN